jgi:hypothetical protein
MVAIPHCVHTISMSLIIFPFAYIFAALYFVVHLSAPFSDTLYKVALVRVGISVVSDLAFSMQDTINKLPLIHVRLGVDHAALTSHLPVDEPALLKGTIGLDLHSSSLNFVGHIILFNLAKID